MLTPEQLESKRIEIALTLKNKRKSLGLTQSDIAEQTGMTNDTISRMEKGKFWLGTKQLSLICEVLKIKIVLDGTPD